MYPRSPTSDLDSLPHPHPYTQPRPHPDKPLPLSDLEIGIQCAELKTLYSERGDNKSNKIPGTESEPSPIHTTSQRTLGNSDAGFHVPDKNNMNTGGTDFGNLGRTYRITTIQHPERSSSHQGAYLSRIPLSPAPILQLDCWDSDGKITIPYDELPFLVCHLTLLTPDGKDATMVVSPERAHRGQTLAMLYGTLVASPVEMTDMTGAAGVYFCYPDVSVRYDGRWKLQATLLRITGGQPLDKTQTGGFDVVPNSGYTAAPFTELTRHFDAQGLVNFGLPRREW